MLNNLPKQLDALKESSNYAASCVKNLRQSLWLLAAVPTDNPNAALAKIDRATQKLPPDGFAVTCNYNGVFLRDSSLDPVWVELNRRDAVALIHPVAVETARTVVDMLYGGTFRKFPKITFILAHCGGALPVLSGCLKLLSTEPWVPNRNKATQGRPKSSWRYYISTRQRLLLPV